MTKRALKAGTWCVVTTTCANRAEAQRLASSIVSNRFGACAQIDDVVSYYWWEGALHHETEWRVTVKTKVSLFAVLKKHICAEHSYSVPEIVALPVIDGSEEYLGWIDEVTKSGKPKKKPR